MSEPMAIEKLAEEHARLQGYLTVSRVPFKKRIGHGDFDVIGYKPETNEVLVIQCKARGPPDSYPNADTPSGKNDLRKQVEELKKDWVSFVNNKVTNLWKLEHFDRVRFIIDGKFSDDKKMKFEKELKTIAGCPVEILPIHEMIEQLFRMIKKDKNERRKRYPDTALEMLRWLIRSVEANALDLQNLQEEMKAKK